MVQDAGLTYQRFKNCRDNLNSWLEHLPRNEMRSRDGPSQIAYKLQVQKVRIWGCRRAGGRYPELGPQATSLSRATSPAGRAACVHVAL